MLARVEEMEGAMLICRTIIKNTLSVVKRTCVAKSPALYPLKEGELKRPIVNCYQKLYGESLSI